MYKFLLCWRYLCTRYIALASIISVMLGVATMIVVNSVMEGFTTEMQNRIHGILSDMVFEARSLEGFRDAEWHMDQIRQVAGDDIAGMSPTVVVPAMLSFQFRGEWITQQVQLIGVDEKTQASVSDFGKYLQHPANREQMTFQLHEGGYDVRDHQAGPESPLRRQMSEAGWAVRRAVHFQQRLLQESKSPATSGRGVAADASKNAVPGSKTAATPPADGHNAAAADPFLRSDAIVANDPLAGKVFDPSKEQYTGCVMGIALSSHRDKDGEDHFLVLPGEDVKLTFATAGTPPKAVSSNFTVVDFYESKMSEYDSSFIFVPVRALQELRGMIDPRTGVGFVNSIQLKLKPGADLDQVRDRLRAAFTPQLYGVYTWRDKQTPLLAAVQVETAILNVILFLIIAVAGFGILAVFYMIVVEKTRDIGILKSLGAPGAGVMGVFLTYGLSLGLVGSGMGLVFGLLFVRYINGIADLLARVTGHKVFDPQIYYFYKIPTIVDPALVGWVMFGAASIAVLASVLPALRAAMLHPVEALRHE